MSLEFGQLVTLTDQKGRTHLIQLEESKQFFTSHGSLEHNQIREIGQGGVISSSNGMQYTIFSTSLQDFVVSMPRGAAVIYPKDASQIIELADLKDGSKVIEAGVGSGSLTLHILKTIGQSGKLVSCEINEEFINVAKKNVAKYLKNLPTNWRTESTDFQNYSATDKFDAVILDLLNPWDMLKNVQQILKPGGHFVSYVATTTQMSKLVETMKITNNWTDPIASETLYREWHLQGLAVRPKHKMNGHTGFLVHARRMADGYKFPVKRQKPAKGAYGSDFEAIQVED